jgi:hypothetical protein
LPDQVGSVKEGVLFLVGFFCTDPGASNVSDDIPVVMKKSLTPITTEIYLFRRCQRDVFVASDNAANSAGGNIVQIDGNLFNCSRRLSKHLVFVSQR